MLTMTRKAGSWPKLATTYVKLLPATGSSVANCTHTLYISLLFTVDSYSLWIEHMHATERRGQKSSFKRSCISKPCTLTKSGLSTCRQPTKHAEQLLSGKHVHLQKQSHAKVWPRSCPNVHVDILR